jgi:CheY-like chemotaxis protein/glycine cleavage system H lipoate-binding protein
MTERLKILVVDDEQVVLDSARKILDSDRLQVLTAADTEAALEMLAAEAPDIVISDLVLPGASGMKLLEIASEQDPGLLIIITTGYSTVENAVAALKHGAFDFLPKPFTCDELLSCVARARRAVELRLTLGASGPGVGHRGDSHLGRQTWARLERDGTALLGVTNVQLQTVDCIERVELPEIGAELRQGGRLVCLHTTDGLAHNLWSPLGGRVLACNDRLRDQPESLRDSPESADWIARILPVDLDGELPNLIEF